MMMAMARPLRLQFPGEIYHVMSRGIERRPIVRDDADRKCWIDWPANRGDLWLAPHAFVLMNNDSHLFLETPEPNLSAGMQFLNGSYTSYFNRRHRRLGTCSRGGTAETLSTGGYFLEVSRYIHLNPVRARLVGRPADWPWSSYAGYRRARDGWSG